MAVIRRSIRLRLVSLRIHSTLLVGLITVLIGLGLSLDAGATPGVRALFYASQSVVPTGSLSYPYRVAVDASGNVYISDTQNNRVLKETLSNGVYTESVVVSTGLATPYGIAVDGSGNIYIADNGHNRVLKEAPSGSSYTQTVVSTTTSLSYPTGLAADASGNVYIADTGGGEVLIEKPSGGSYTETALTYSSNFAQITGIAVDSSGNIYVSDIDNQAVYMETYSAGSYTPSTIPTSGLSYPYDLAVDASGNLYISDFTNKRIVLETNNSGSYTQSVLPTATLGGALGVAIGGGGNLYIADTFGFNIKELQWQAGNFGPVQVASHAGPISMLFQFYGGGATLALTGESVSTEGVASLDFTDAGSGNCSTTSPYNPGDFCWVDVDFSPMYPGTRMGAAQLLGTSGALLATGYIYGMGVGPQVNYSYQEFDFTTVYRVAGSYAPYDITNPFAAAVDAGGNIYVADYNNNAVYEESPSGGSYTQTTVASGLNNPEAVAVDGAGNVYICDSGNNQILLETNTGGGWVQTAVATGLDFPTGIAVDASGDVYFSSFSDGAVYVETLYRGSYTLSTVVTGLNEPRKIAVDASGNVYIADTGNSRVVKETLSGGSYTQSVIGSGMTYPYGVAVAADGNVFVADTINSRILAETWSGGSYTQSVLIPGPPAYDVQVDEMGDLIFPDPADATVFFINYTQSPSLSFASTYIGSTSTDSPQTLGIVNVGNASLDFTVPGSGDNPSIQAGFVLSSGSAGNCPLVASGGSAGSLAVGTSCTLPVSFEPVSAGTDSGSLSIATNSLNAATTTADSLSGTGIAPDTTATAVAVSPGLIQAGGTVSVTATVTDTVNSGTTPTGSVTFTDTVGSTTVNLNSGNPVTLNGSGVAALSGIALSGSGTHFITASYGGALDIATSSGTGTVMVDPSANVGSSTAAFPVTLTFTAAGTLGAINVLTQGASGMDFTDAGTGDTCTVTSSYSVSDTCTVNVVFSPTAPGLRSGAVILVDGSGNVLAEIYLSGEATAPQLTFATTTAGYYAPSNETIATGFEQSTGVAFDGSGNLFVADAGEKAIYELAPSCASVSCATELASSFSFGEPQSVDVDGAGNVLVADESGSVYQIVAASGYTTVNTLGGGFGSPRGVAVDAYGDVFIADFNNAKIYEIPLGCIQGANNAGCVVTLAGSYSFSEPYSVAVDGSGNVYVIDLSLNAVAEITFASGYTTVNQLGSGLNVPFGVAVDAAGDLFVADDGNQAVKEFVAVSGSVPASPSILLLGRGYATPIAVAVDAHGNLAVADNGAIAEADKLDYADPPSLSFATTAVDATSSDSPQTVAVSNDGDATLNLTASGVAPATDFPLASSGAGVCAASGSLTAGGSCTLPIDFTPQSAGSKSESLTLTDNNLEADAATQSIALTGTASAITFNLPSSTTLAAGTVAASYSPVAFGATGGTSPYTYAVSGGALPAGLTLSSTGSLSGTPTAGGSFSFTVTATDQHSQTGVQVYSLIVNPPIISLAPSLTTLTAGVYNASYSQTFTASGGTSAYTFTHTGTLPPGLTLSTGGVLSGAPTAVGGPYSFTVTATDSSTGTGPYSGSLAYTLTIGQAAATVTLTPSSLTQTYSGSALAVAVTTTPASLAVACTYVGISGTTYASSSTAPTNAGSYSVSCAINNANYTGSATGTLVIGQATATVTLTPSSLTQTYSGLALAAAVTTTPASLPLTLSYTGTSGTTYGPSATAPTNAGSYTVTATVNSPNYTGSSTGTLTISLATATVTLTPASLTQTYTGSPLAVAVTTSPASLPVTLSYTGTGGTTYGPSATAPTNAGSYTVTATVNSPNYTGSATGTLVIGQATATVTLSSLTQTYTGSPLAVAITTSPASLAVTLSYTGTGGTTYGPSATAPTNAGSYTVTATVNSPNYTGSATGTLVIGQATATVTLSSLTQTYTGSPLAVAITTSPASLAVACTYVGTGGTTYVSSGTAPTDTGSYSVSCAIDNANYTGSATGTLSIISFSVVSSSGGSVGGNNTITTLPGGAVSDTINITPSSGTTLPTAMLLTVTGLPAGATVSVQPSTWTQQTSTTWTLPAFSTLGQVTIDIQLPSTTASMSREGVTRSKLPLVLWGLLLLPFAGFMRRTGRRLSRLGQAVLLLACTAAGLAVATGLSGCGSTSGFFGQAQQSYTVSETVSSSTYSQSTSFIISVK